MSIVIIGTGMAGYNLAREIRKSDSEVPLVLVTADAGEAYPKPALSNALIQGKQPGQIVSADAATMAERLNAVIHTHTRVLAIDSANRQLITDQGNIPYARLVLATGARPIRLPFKGDGADAVLSVNDLEEYRIFRAQIEQAKRVAIIGPGLIGCEFANDLSLGGYQVELVAPCEQVMPGLLHPAAAAAVQAGLESLGARFHLGPLLASLEHAGEGLQGRLSDGTPIACDLVLSAVGLRPRTELAAAAGLAVNRGVVVDRELRSSHANIYALGDCAEVDGLNLQYVMPLMHCARALAQTLAGKPSAVRYGPMPVTVKTPVCPLVVSPPPRGLSGEWTVEGSGSAIKALCRDAAGGLLGYALTGTAVQEKLALNRQLPALLA
jgi:rubredoxin-NAD+ reductase